MLDVGHRVDRGSPPQLTNPPLGDAVHAVDVRLAKLAAVGVDGQPTADLDGPPVGDEVLRLTPPPAEPELLELNQGKRREVVVENGGLDVGRLQRTVPTSASRPGPSREDRRVPDGSN